MFLLNSLSLWNIAKIAVFMFLYTNSNSASVIGEFYLIVFFFSFYYGLSFLFLCVICSFGCQTLETLPLLVPDMFFLLVTFLSCVVGCS